MRTNDDIQTSVNRLAIISFKCFVGDRLALHVVLTQYKSIDASLFRPHTH